MTVVNMERGFLVPKDNVDPDRNKKKNKQKSNLKLNENNREEKDRVRRLSNALSTVDN